jgi:hypothetical protein
LDVLAGRLAPSAEASGALLGGERAVPGSVQVGRVHTGHATHGYYAD